MAAGVIRDLLGTQMGTKATHAILITLRGDHPTASQLATEQRVELMEEAMLIDWIESHRQRPSWPRFDACLNSPEKRCPLTQDRSSMATAEDGGPSRNECGDCCGIRNRAMECGLGFVAVMLSAPEAIQSIASPTCAKRTAFPGVLCGSAPAWISVGPRLPFSTSVHPVGRMPLGRSTVAGLVSFAGSSGGR